MKGIKTEIIDKNTIQIKVTKDKKVCGNAPYTWNEYTFPMARFEKALEGLEVLFDDEYYCEMQISGTYSFDDCAEELKDLNDVDWKRLGHDLYRDIEIENDGIYLKLPNKRVKLPLDSTHYLYDNDDEQTIRFLFRRA